MDTGKIKENRSEQKEIPEKQIWIIGNLERDAEFIDRLEE